MDYKEPEYMNREIDEMFQDIKKDLSSLIIQTTKTNGRVTRIEKIITIILTAIGMLTITRPDLLAAIIKLIGI